METPVRIAVGAALLLASVTAGLTALAYSRQQQVTVDFARGAEDAFVVGFHPRERGATGYYRWTRATSVLELHHLPRRGRFDVEARLRTIRPVDDSKVVVFTANGVSVHVAAVEPGTGIYRFTFPSAGSDLRLGIETEPFVAGGRRLGIQVLEVSLRFADDARPSWPEPAAWMALVAVLFFGAAKLAGLSTARATIAAGIASGAFVFLLGRNPVPFTTYPKGAVVLAAITLVVVALGHLGLQRAQWFDEARRPTVLVALAFCLVLKMGMLFYPLMVCSDADFQVNRMAAFVGGNWYPSSVTQHQPSFEIPYPVSLYALAALVSELGLANLVALKLTTGTFDVAVSFALMYAGWRFLDDVTAGILAGVSYQLVPMNALAFSAGNFTNLFAIAALTLVFLLFAEAASGARRAAVGCGLFALFALTAHFGMLVEATVLFPAWLVVTRRRGVDGSASRLTLALAVSVAVAAIYYLGYWEMVSSQWRRALEGSSVVVETGFGAKSMSLASRFREQLGLAFMAAAAFGAFRLVRERYDGWLGLGALAWFSVTALFLVVDLVSAVGIRYPLQVLPLLALSAGAGVARAFRGGRMARAMGGIACVIVIGVGLGTLRSVLLAR